MGRPRKKPAVSEESNVIDSGISIVGQIPVEEVPRPLSLEAPVGQALPSPTEREGADFDSEDDILEREGALLEKQVAEFFQPEALRKIKRVCYYISKVGLDFNEACMISRVAESEYRQWMVMSPALTELMSIKELEYKAALMMTLGAKARMTGGDKIAQWLLQAKGYGPKKGTGGDGDGDDLIAAGIEFVRKNGDSNSLVSETSGRAFVVRKTKETTTDMLRGLLA